MSAKDETQQQKHQKERPHRPYTFTGSVELLLVTVQNHCNWGPIFLPWIQEEPVKRDWLNHVQELNTHEGFGCELRTVSERRPDCPVCLLGGGLNTAQQMKPATAVLTTWTCFSLMTMHGMEPLAPWHKQNISCSIMQREREREREIVTFRNVNEECP